MSTTLTDHPARFATGLREIAPGTHAWLQPNGGLGESNAGLVVGAGESLLIDTLWDHRLTERMLAAMAATVDGAPITRVLNSHSDGDHWWGNHVVPAGAEIVASTTAAATMRDDVTPRELALLTRAVRAGAWIPGTRTDSLRASAGQFAPFDFAGVRLRYPDRTFSARETFAVGGREVEAIEVGPAHTAGDTIVHVADVGVVFAADVLFIGCTPMMWAGPVDNWIAATELLLDLDADTYVPGHGDLGTRRDVELVRDYWTWLRDRAREHHQAERPRMLAAQAILDDPDFAWSEWDDSERVVLNVDTLYRGFEGRGPVGARGRERMGLMRDVAALGQQRAR